MVRELATLRHAHADWPARLLGRLGELYLLVRAFRNLPNLEPRGPRRGNPPANGRQFEERSPADDQRRARG